jgi:hypothetical protein
MSGKKSSSSFKNKKGENEKKTGKKHAEDHAAGSASMPDDARRYHIEVESHDFLHNPERYLHVL